MTTWADGTTTILPIGTIDRVNQTSVADRHPLVYDSASGKFQPFGKSPQLTPAGVAEMHLQWNPPATGWGITGGVVARPVHLEASYNGTDTLLGTDNVSQGIVSSMTFGDPSHAPIGTVHGFSSRLSIQNSGDSTNEYCPYFGFLRWTTGVTANPGRSWFTDWNVQGAIGLQHSLFNGISMFMNNYYNGSPSVRPSTGIAATTNPGTGGGGTAAHTAAFSYPMDVGVIVVGASGTPGVGENIGWQTGIRVGGVGGPWNVVTSRIGTGIELLDFVNYGLHISGRKAGATGPAIRVSDTAGPVLISTSTGSGSGGTAMLEVYNSTVDKSPIALFGSLQSGRNSAIDIRNGNGFQRQFIAGTASAYITGTVAGDSGVNINGGGTAAYHLGGTAKVLTVTQDNKAGFFAATPVLQQAAGTVATDLASVITLANALRTALVNLGLAA